MECITSANQYSNIGIRAYTECAFLTACIDVHDLVQFDRADYFWSLRLEPLYLRGSGSLPNKKMVSSEFGFRLIFTIRNARIFAAGSDVNF